MWFAIAIVAFTVAAAFDYRWLRTFALADLPGQHRAAVLTLVIGVTINGAQRWVSLGGLTSSSPRSPRC